MGDNSSLSNEINELIKTDGEVENLLISQLETLEKLRKIDFSLSYNNWNITNVLQDITKKNEYLSKKTQKLTDDYENYNNEVKLLKLKKSQLAENAWQRFTKDSQHYQHLITSAEEEYKSNNLVSDIHHYDLILKEVNNQILNTICLMEELTDQFGLNELGTNVETNHLEKIQSFIDSLKKDQLPISNSIKNYENEKNSITKKIKQKENDIKYLMSKND